MKQDVKQQLVDAFREFVGPVWSVELANVAERIVDDAARSDKDSSSKRSS